MANLKYTVEISGSEPVCGSIELDNNANHIRAFLPEGIIESVRAEIPVPTADDDRIFMNGYQTWTYCPEYTKKSRIRGCKGIPKAIVKHYGLDRYGDYHFVEYPYKAGITHGTGWCYFRSGSNFRLFASLDEKPGYTLFRYDANEEILYIERDCKGLHCDGEYPLFDLFYGSGEEEKVFDRWFRFLEVVPRTTEYIAGYSSWYNRYQNINEQCIGSDLSGCAGLLRKGDLFQIDDGWEPYVGDWLEADKKKFPSGMKTMADDIHARGLKAGLWLAPFVCQKGSAIYNDHPDWLLKVDGEPWYCGCNWGGFWALDIDNSEVVDYIERVFDTVLNKWGYDLVKLDFLYAAAPYGSDTETRAARMIRAVDLLRRVCGDKLILGCGVPLMPAFGKFDYCRIGCDVSLDWNDKLHMRAAHRERVSTRQSIGNSIFRRQLNGRAFLNDPDVFFLRDKNIRLNPQQKHILSTVNAVFGGVFLCSDNMAEYSEEARNRYSSLLGSRQAENIVVDTSDGLRFSYTVNGVERKVRVE